MIHLAPLLLALPQLNTMLGGAVEQPIWRDLAITCFKGVKRGVTAR